MLWMRINAPAAAALLSLLSPDAVQAQSPSANAQFMMQHQQMMNQMDMMRRSQQLQAMWRAREAQRRSRSSAHGAAGKKRQAAAPKHK